VVLLLFSGRPLTLPWAFAHVPAVMAAWFPGVQAGPALVNVLFGNVAPSGRLVVSWPRTVGQIPIYYNASNTGRPPGNIDLTRPPADAQERFVSRYVDEVNAPQFPFGFGLTYTKFAYTKPEVAAGKLSARTLNEQLRANKAADTTMTVDATVSNTGNVAAETVVQLYVGVRGTDVEEPVRKLAGFQKVALGPAESKHVSFRLGPEAFAIWDVNNEWKVEPCRVRVWVSADSASGEPVEAEIAQ